MRDSLRGLLDRWELWAKSADQAEDGWQALFPEWRCLISAASKKMAAKELSESELKDVEFVWLISEEDEDMIDQVKAEPEGCLPVLTRLAASSHPMVRWQVYVALSHVGAQALPLLREALKDEDPYCRRRALWALVPLKPKDAVELANRFADDPDPHMRQAAKELLR
jgi:HEAT repeat protein